MADAWRRGLSLEASSYRPGRSQRPSLTLSSLSAKLSDLEYEEHAQQRNKRRREVLNRRKQVSAGHAVAERLRRCHNGLDAPESLPDASPSVVPILPATAVVAGLRRDGHVARRSLAVEQAEQVAQLTARLSASPGSTPGPSPKALGAPILAPSAPPSFRVSARSRGRPWSQTRSPAQAGSPQRAVGNRRQIDRPRVRLGVVASELRKAGRLRQPRKPKHPAGLFGEGSRGAEGGGGGGGQDQAEGHASSKSRDPYARLGLNRPEHVNNEHGHLLLGPKGSNPKYTQDLMRKTGYSRRQLVAMFMQFKGLVQMSASPAGIDPTTFRQAIPMLSLEDASFVERVHRLLDEDGSGTIEWDEFLEAMSKLEKGSRVQRASFLFDCYDDDGGGTIDEEEMQGYFMSSLRIDPDTVDESTTVGQQLCEMATDVLKDVNPSGTGELSRDEVIRFVMEHKEIEDVASVFGRSMEWAHRLREELQGDEQLRLDVTRLVGKTQASLDLPDPGDLGAGDRSKKVLPAWLRSDPVPAAEDRPESPNAAAARLAGEEALELRLDALAAAPAPATALPEGAAWTQSGLLGEGTGAGVAEWDRGNFE